MGKAGISSDWYRDWLRAISQSNEMGEAGISPDKMGEAGISPDWYRVMKWVKQEFPSIDTE